MKKFKIIYIIISFLIILSAMYTGCDLYNVSTPERGNSSSNNSSNTSSNLTWTKLLGVSETSTHAESIIADIDENIYVAGYTTGNLDGEILTGSEDLFVIKYNSNGEKQWTRLLGASGESTNAYGITSDTDGNLYATGYTSGNLDDQTLTGFRDLFIVKYNSNGNKQWTKLLGAHGSTFAYGITSDINENIYVAGYTTGNLDGEILTGSEDLFVIKYNSNGEKQWTRLLGISGAETRAISITSDADKNVYATGNTTGNLDDQTLTGFRDLFIVKYNSNGEKQWTRLLGALGIGTSAESIITDTDGNLYVTGYTSGNLDGQILTGATDLFIVKYNANGDKQ